MVAAEMIIFFLTTARNDFKTWYNQCHNPFNTRIEAFTASIEKKDYQDVIM